MTEESPAPDTAMLVFAEQMEPIIALVVGHRTQLLAEGFNETAAEAMSIAFHSMMMTMIIKQSQTPVAT